MPPTDRRRFPRSRPRPSVDCLVWPAQGATVADVLNLSPGGALLVCFRPFPPGTELGLTLYARPAPARCEVHARVVRFGAIAPGSYHVACEFSRPLGPAELHPLLP